MRVVCWVVWRYYSGNKECVIKKNKKGRLGKKITQQAFSVEKYRGVTGTLLIIRRCFFSVSVQTSPDPLALL